MSRYKHRSDKVCDGDRLTVARVTSVMNSTLTSLLTVNLSESMQRKTIKCIHNNGSDEEIIGVTELLLNGIKFNHNNYILW